MEGICIGKGLWLQQILHLDHFNAKQGVVVCRLKLQKKKKVPAVSLHKRVTLAATLHWFRFAVCYFDGCEWIASGLITITSCLRL